VDEDLYEILFLVDIGRHPERVDDLDGEPALFCNPQVVKETRTVEVGVEALRFFEEDHVRPSATPGDDGHVLLRPDQPLDIPGRHQGYVSHDDERRAVKLPERPVDGIVEGFCPDSDERVIVLEGVGAEQGGAAPRSPGGGDHVFKHRPGERLPLFLV